MANDDLVVGLDIGSTKIAAVIGELNENGGLEITGVGTSPSTGLRKSVVVNIETTLRAIQQAIEAAEMMSGRVVNSCWTCIGGSHIDGVNSRGVVAVTGKNREMREISADDIERVIEAARAVVIPMDRQVLEVIPQSFTVDAHKGIRDPLDMIGVRLEAEVHIITCALTGSQNIVKCVNRAGFRVNGLILQTLAAGSAVLTPEEKELGVALVDLGGGTTNVLVYQHGAPHETLSIPAGGVQVTNDISIVENVAFDIAEKIKIEAGCCWEPLLGTIDEDIIVPGVGGRAPVSIPRSHILGIVKPRMKETLQMVKDRLAKVIPARNLGCGIVLTGGGAELSGAVDLAAEVFGLPVRLGVPFQMGGVADEWRTPSYATAMGLVMEGFEREGRLAAVREGGEEFSKKGAKENIFARMVKWVKDEWF